jgi:hypothetical protein
VLSEYRRFLYLAAVAGKQVVPPPVIHRIWQLHAKDHQNYTVDLVRGLIGRPMPDPFELSPPLGDPAHARTREHYRREFGQPAPRALWPGANAMRFRQVLDLVIPALGVLAGLMFVSQYLARAAVAVLAAIACLILRDRTAPWIIRTPNTDLDFDFGANDRGAGEGPGLFGDGD